MKQYYPSQFEMDQRIKELEKSHTELLTLVKNRNMGGDMHEYWCSGEDACDCLPHKWYQRVSAAIAIAEKLK